MTSKGWAYSSFYALDMRILILFSCVSVYFCVGLLKPPSIYVGKDYAASQSTDSRMLKCVPSS